MTPNNGIQNQNKNSNMQDIRSGQPARHVDPNGDDSRLSEHRRRIQDTDPRFLRRQNNLSDNDVRPPREHKQNFITRLVNNWFDRVMGAMKGEGLSESAAQYESHRTTRDFIWNSVGAAAWGAVFPLVTMVSTQLVGTEQAGMISMAFVVGILLMFLGNFGARTYQISDIHEEHSFLDYQISRWITCIVMVACGWFYCSIRGYSQEMFDISIAIILYKMIDALADVYEGRLQQVDKLYLAGISQTLRSALAFIVFAILLFITHSPVVSCYGMAIAAAATFVVVTWPLTLLESPKSKTASIKSILSLFKLTAPLFVAIFFFNVVENMPKFAMEGLLPYDNQLYYNALYFPAQTILLTSQLVYKPLLLRIAGVWQDASKRLKFNLILVGLTAVIIGITAVFWLVMAWVGIPVLNFLYGVDFAQYKGLLYIMLITGGITALIDFLYQVITIMRRQKDVTVIFLITFVFSLFIPYLLVNYAELEGAVLSYLIIESIMLTLLGWEYFRIRRNLNDLERARTQAVAQVHERTTFVPLMDPADPELSEGEGAEGVVEDVPQRMLPSEARAIRQHREEVMRRRTGKRQ